MPGLSLNAAQVQRLWNLDPALTKVVLTHLADARRLHKIERAYGKFVRRFELPTEVDAAKVQAEFKDGVLNVHLPKSPHVTPKTIQVKVN